MGENRAYVAMSGGISCGAGWQWESNTTFDPASDDVLGIVPGAGMSFGTDDPSLIVWVMTQTAGTTVSPQPTITSRGSPGSIAAGFDFHTFAASDGNYATAQFSLQATMPSLGSPADICSPLTATPTPASFTVSYDGMTKNSGAGAWSDDATGTMADGSPPATYPTIHMNDSAPGVGDDGDVTLVFTASGMPSGAVDWPGHPNTGSGTGYSWSTSTSTTQLTLNIVIDATQYDESTDAVNVSFHAVDHVNGAVTMPTDGISQFLATVVAF